VSPLGFHARSIEYAFRMAHLRDNFIHDAKFSQFGLSFDVRIWTFSFTPFLKLLFFMPVRNQVRCPVFKNRANTRHVGETFGITITFLLFAL
jgi:hypothetical protein